MIGFDQLKYWLVSIHIDLEWLILIWIGLDRSILVWISYYWFGLVIIGLDGLTI